MRQLRLAWQRVRNAATRLQEALKGPSDPAARRFSSALGPAFLIAAVLFQALLLFHETRVERYPVNDAVLHEALSQRLVVAAQRGEDPLDPWVSTFSLGYPVWRTYQPLAHGITALATAALAPFADRFLVYGLLTWVLLCLQPVAFYAAARLLGIRPPGAGVAALLCLAASATGDFGRFGQGYGAYVWRGSGLYTQLWAVPLLVLALGASARAIRTGRRLATASLLVSLTALAHIIFGYAAALSAAMLAVVPPGPPGETASLPRRLFRLAWIGSGTALVTAFLVVPALLDAPYVNHSRWEPAWKWGSFGASKVLQSLLRGRLLDAGRLPVLTALLLLGAAAAILTLRRPAARALLSLTGLWLVLFFGRATWGTLTRLLPLSGNIHMHRFEAVFGACAVLLAGYGVDVLLGSRLCQRTLAGCVAAAALVVLLLVPPMRERARFLRGNAAYAGTQMTAWKAEEADMDSLLRQLRQAMRERPGRAYAGPAAGWGGDFLVGSSPFYDVLARAGIDTASFLWHAMSLTSDAMVLVDDSRPGQVREMGIRYVVAPAGHTVPPFLRRLGLHGRFALYEVELDDVGYLGAAALPALFEGGPQEIFPLSRAWMESAMPQAGQFIAVAGTGPDLPAAVRLDGPDLPETSSLPPPAARVEGESAEGEVHEAVVDLPTPGPVVFRMTYHPGWRATSDGRPVPTRMVVPGFLAADMPAGRHRLRLEYRPGPIKAVLLLLGLAGFGLLVWGERAGAAAGMEARFSRLADGVRRVVPAVPAGVSAHSAALLAVAGLTVLAMRPFFTGDLVAGHDASGYPIRLVEFHENVRRGVVPPLWAPDLGSGHGQPHFAFAPPLLYATAEAFLLLGGRPVASLNAALVLLALGGAIGAYAAGSRLGGRQGGIVASAAYLFGGYFLVELYVRGAYMEFAGLCVLPWAFLALVLVIERPSGLRLAGAAAAVALLALSHNAVLLMAAPALALAGLMHATARKDARPLLAGGIAGTWGLALAAWYWLPALAEIGHAHLDRLLRGHTRYDLHFLWARQLWRSPWGYGLSVAGPGDGMPFDLGRPQLLLAVAGLLAVWGWRRREPPWRRAAGLSAGLLALAGCLFACWPSKPVWDAFGSLQYLQFPWRFLVLPAAFLPLLAAAAVTLWDRMALLRPGRWRTLGAVVFAGAILAAQMPRARPRDTVPLDEKALSPETIAERGLSATTFQEYEPVQVLERPPYDPLPARVEEGSAEIAVGEKRPDLLRLSVRADVASSLRLETFWFPGWEVRVDGRPVPVRHDPPDGLMRFDVPAGEHEVVARLRATKIRAAARGVSLLALLAWFVAVAFPAARRFTLYSPYATREKEETDA